MSQAFTFKRKIISIAILSTFCMSQNAFAEDATTEKTISVPVVVTATRVEQNSFDLPVAIDVVNQKDIQDGQLQMTLSESLIRVPGITAQNRTQSAQDPQISSRGFGSRSSFGVRGIRLYVDGIPLTMPDGQGQPGVVDLSSIKSIEVMRGPFSALYGNSSGGVIQMLTEDAPKSLEEGGTAMFGSYDTNRQVLNAAGTSENVEYLLNTSNFHTGGYRQNSESDKQAATAKFRVNISDDTKITTLVNWFDQSAQDPVGLDRARAFNSNTRVAVVPAAIFANTSVKRDHTQIGFNFEHAFDEHNKITLIPYIGSRSNAQILTTTATATTKATTNARLSEIDRDFYGIDAHWDNNGEIGSLPYILTFGLNYGKQNDARLDTNILLNGAKVATKNRDEDNIADNFDEYLQGKLSVLDNVDLHAGVRHTDVELKVKDHFLTAGNPGQGDNSGSVEYKKTTPVIGAIWKVTPTFNLYTNYGIGFETPTFVEAAFDNVSNNVASKPNLSLKAAKSRNYEIGAKTFIGDNTNVNLTLFKTSTKDEIVTAVTNAGRSSFTNASKTERKGVEFSIDSNFENNISTYFSYTLLDAKFEDTFTFKPTTSTTRTVLAGNKIPGTYKSQIYGEVAWKYAPFGFSTALEGRHNSKVYVDDLNSDTAAAYTIFNIRAGLEQNLSNWHLTEYVRVENITDKDYIGSIRVNDGNGLFFEPAAGRNYLLGLSANYKF
jgi:iron complex outermembrane receptor protein